ncbi:hypothetical protein CBS63078_8095 [Aspergillus niger]|nr:hypothetical protein CBS133816_10830 [Aspergillus niger]KAI2815796.1 hypothetical protein CBS115989_7359 [Aspergillus niger]KAI2844177.1 hypothetical protein CBS11350_4950 [Aspergillus niger]KAI2848186.1 hypothetical protein CBS11232_6903 [Aspergillus niger]KAI2863461.1 hypothetical protein CBS12448_3759 [Aspergillus niger]
MAGYIVTVLRQSHRIPGPNWLGSPKPPPASYLLCLLLASSLTVINSTNTIIQPTLFLQSLSHSKASLVTSVFGLAILNTSFLDM